MRCAFIVFVEFCWEISIGYLLPDSRYEGSMIDAGERIRCDVVPDRVLVGLSVVFLIEGYRLPRMSRVVIEEIIESMQFDRWRYARNDQKGGVVDEEREIVLVVHNFACLGVEYRSISCIYVRFDVPSGRNVFRRNERRFCADEISLAQDGECASYQDQHLARRKRCRVPPARRFLP